MIKYFLFFMLFGCSSTKPNNIEFRDPHQFCQSYTDCPGMHSACVYNKCFDVSVIHNTVQPEKCQVDADCFSEKLCVSNVCEDPENFRPVRRIGKETRGGVCIHNVDCGFEDICVNSICEKNVYDD